MPNKDHHRISEAAKYLGVSSKTLRRYGKSGKLVAKRSMGGQRYYTKEQLDIFKIYHSKKKQEETEATSSTPITTPSHSAPTLPHQNKYRFGAALFSFIFGLISVSTAYIYTSASQIQKDQLTNDTIYNAQQPQVLAAATDANSPSLSSFVFSVNVPSKFTDTVTFEKNITAQNVVYSVNGKSGALNLTAGSGITVDGMKVTNSDTGSSQKIFKTIKVGSTSFDAGDNTSTLEFVGSGGASISIDTANKKLTFSSAAPDYTLSGWTDSGTTVSLTTLTDSVEVGDLTANSVIVNGITILDGNVTVGNGVSILPDTDLGSDLGSSSYRFNNLWVANINSNSSQSFSGQTTFSYPPTSGAITQASVLINPTTSAADGQLLGLGIAGYQRAMFDEDGDLTLGYADLTSAPASDYPLNIYGHSGTRVSFVDTTGNGYFAGKVGIGTTDPGTYKVQVIGDGTNPALVVNNAVGNGGPLILGASGSSGNGVRLNGNATNGGVSKIYSDYFTTEGDLVLGTYSNRTSQLYLQKTGNVGIGTTSPTAGYKLDVAGQVQIQGMYSTGNIQSGNTLIATALNTQYIRPRAGAGSIQFQNYGESDKMIILDGGNVGIGTTAPRTSLEIGGDGAILATGTYGSGWTEPNLGAGTRMVWYPRVAAFRVGSVSGTEWNAANIGAYSFAAGIGAKASGTASFAVGNSSQATAEYASAFGLLSTAGGERSFTSGYYTKTNYSSVAFGRFNVGSGSLSSWVDTDPLFELGMGTADGARANALTVLKNGNIGIGATSPGSKLVIAGTDPSVDIITTNTAPNYSTLYFSSSANSKAIYLQGLPGSNGLNIVAGNRAIFNINATTETVYNDSSYDIDFRIKGDNDAALLFADAGNDRIGIGTTAPGAKLEIKYASANISTTTPAFIINNPTGGSQSVLYLQNDGVKNASLRADNSGNLVVSASGGDLYLGSDGTQTNIHGFAGGTEKLTVLSGGNVGIGTTAPGSALDVYGKLQITSAGNLNADASNNGTGLITAGYTSGFALSGSVLSIKRGTNMVVYNSGYQAPGHKFGLVSNITSAIDAGIMSAVGTFAPTDGTGEFVGLLVNPTINQTGTATGNYTALRVNTVETAALGTNKLLADFQTNGLSKMVVTSAGNVGIGTTAPSEKIEVVGNIKTSSLTTGTVYSNAGVLTNTDPSDINLKNNILNLPDGTLAKVRGLRPVSYNWKSTGNGALGFIAQDVAEIFPELVGHNSDGTLGLYTTQFIPLLTKAIQEQQLQIDNLQGDSQVTANASITSSNWDFFTNLVNELKTMVDGIQTKLTAMTEEFTTKKSHQEELCIGKEGFETCLTKDQIDAVLQNLPSPTPSASPSPEPSISPSPTASGSAEPSLSPTPSTASDQP